MSEVKHPLSTIDISKLFTTEPPYVCKALRDNPDLKQFDGVDFQEYYTVKRVCEFNVYYQIEYEWDEVEDVKIISEADWLKLPRRADKYTPLWDEIHECKKKAREVGINHYSAQSDWVQPFHLEDMLTKIDVPKLLLKEPEFGDTHG